MLAAATDIRACFEARDRWEAHFDGCRTCGCGGRLCAEGTRLHTAYADRKNIVEGARPR